MTELLAGFVIGLTVTLIGLRNPKRLPRADRQKRLQRLDRAQRDFNAWYKREAAKTRDMRNG